MDKIKRGCFECLAYVNVCGIPMCLLGYNMDKTIKCSNPKNEEELGILINIQYPQKTTQGEKICQA